MENNNKRKNQKFMNTLKSKYFFNAFYINT